MNGDQKQGSEVARLLAQIRAEYEAAHLGLGGLAYGTGTHAFITQKMDNMGKLHEELKAIVGESAMDLVVEQLRDVPDTSRTFAP
jgi:hypothetical protein